MSEQEQEQERIKEQEQEQERAINEIIFRKEHEDNIKTIKKLEVEVENIKSILEKDHNNYISDTQLKTEFDKLKTEYEQFKLDVIKSVRSIYDRVINDAKEPIVLESRGFSKFVHADTINHDISKYIKGHGTYNIRAKAWLLDSGYDTTFTELVNKDEKYLLILK